MGDQCARQLLYAAAAAVCHLSLLFIYCYLLSVIFRCLLLCVQILDLSKIEAGKLELEQRTFNVRQCIEGAVDVVSERCAKKGLDLHYYAPVDNPLLAIGDITRLRQIIINLLSNAKKFTHQGEVTVTCVPKLLAVELPTHVTAKLQQPSNASSNSNGDAAAGLLSPVLPLNNALRDTDVSKFSYYEFLFEIRDTGIGIGKHLCSCVIVRCFCRLSLLVHYLQHALTRCWLLSLRCVCTLLFVAEENMHRLFKTFSQAETSVSRNFGGTG